MYTLYGALGSPYSLKMRAVLRYPDGHHDNDSTPLIWRSAIPIAESFRPIRRKGPGDTRIAGPAAGRCVVGPVTRPFTLEPEAPSGDKAIRGNIGYRLRVLARVA